MCTHQQLSQGVLVMSLTNLTWFLFTYKVVCLMCFVKESVLCWFLGALPRKGRTSWSGMHIFHTPAFALHSMHLGTYVISRIGEENKLCGRLVVLSVIWASLDVRYTNKCDLRAVNISSSSAISLPDGIMICVVRICLSQCIGCTTLWGRLSGLA